MIIFQHVSYFYSMLVAQPRASLSHGAMNDRHFVVFLRRSGNIKTDLCMKMLLRNHNNIVLAALL